MRGAKFLWTSVPIFFLLALCVGIRVVLIVRLTPFVWEDTLVCNESYMLTWTCSLVLMFSVFGGEFQDCTDTWEYIHGIPHDDSNNMSFLAFSVEVDGAKGKGYCIEKGGISYFWRAVGISVCVVIRAVICCTILLYGILYIALTESDEDKIKDCVAFLIISDLDDIFYRFAVPKSSRELLDRVPALSVANAIDVQRDVGAQTLTFFTRVVSVAGGFITPIAAIGLAGAVLLANCWGGSVAAATTMAILTAGWMCVRPVFSTCTFDEDGEVRVDVEAAVIGAASCPRARDTE